MTDTKAPSFCNFILDSIPVAMVTMDSAFIITSFNNHAEHLTGFQATEAIGRPCYEILHSSKCDTECPLQTVQKQGEASTGLEAEIINRFHEHIPVRIGTAAIENSSNNFVGYLEVIEDISREKSLEREKNNFLFMVAHDMKSPLVAMRGLLGRLSEHHRNMSAEKCDENLKIIDNAGMQIETQVVNFLEYSRQVNNKIKLTLEYIDLPQLISELIQRHSEEAAQKNITIRAESIPLKRFKADFSKMQRVFENLIDNAIKFSEQKGEITISITETDKELIIQVKDCGPGIPVDELPFIFDAFHQHNSCNAGHGLGLTAVRAIVQEHGGRVAVKNRRTQGSVFSVRLPKNS